MPRVILFDVHETLLDLRALASHFERVFGDAAVRAQWFAPVEYMRAVMELAKARPLALLRLMGGKLVQRMRRLFRMRTRPDTEA